MTLSRKVLLLALLNLGVLSIGFGLLVWFQLGLGTESIVLGPARQRILSIANSFELEMRATPRLDQAGLLANYGKLYSADFHLVDPRGESLTTEQVSLPRELLDRLHRPRAGAPPPAVEDESPPPPPPPPPAREDREKEDREKEDRARRDAHRLDEQIFLVAPKSGGYWVGVRMPVRSSENPDPEPGVLLIHSGSIFANSLLVDWSLWILIPVGVLFVSALCWLPFVRGLTHSVSQMSHVTGKIAMGQFDARVEELRRDELGRLGAEINDLAARLQSFVRNQKRFLGDTAHELSAPLARIQFALGILEQKAEDSSRSHVETLRAEIQEMSELVSELLSFSKAGMDPDGVKLAPIPLAPLIERAVAREKSGGAPIDVSVDPGLHVLANESYLSRALSNLIRNAIRYAGDAGPIQVSAAVAQHSVEITVADSGPGVSEESLGQLFVPFYRPESSRSRDLGGTGLGLAIVESCVKACRGTVVCKNRVPRGLEVRITLESA